MKKIIASFIALYSVFAFSATTTPVQLLNPTGSTSGQAITSSGPTNPPAWGSVGVAGGGTGSSTLTAHGVLLGQGTSAVTAVVPGAAGTLLTSTGTSTDPAFQALSSSSIAGVTNGSNAAAGIVGEYNEVTSSSTAITSNTPTNVTSLSLTAGDWDIYGNIYFGNGSGTTLVNALGGIGTASATLPSTPLYTFANGISVGSGSAVSLVVPHRRINLASTTTIYLVAQTQFTGGTCSTIGILQARRAR